MAGQWCGWVSLPILQFLLLRWYLRLLPWARLLWQVSRTGLRLVPTHPDRADGLGFLAETGHALSLLAAAHDALVAAQIASRIFFAGETLPQFVGLIGIELVFVLCLTLGPMLFVAGQLIETKRMGLREYGALAGRYVQAFDAKWLRGGARLPTKRSSAAPTSSRWPTWAAPASESARCAWRRSAAKPCSPSPLRRWPRSHRWC